MEISVNRGLSRFWQLKRIRLFCFSFIIPVLFSIIIGTAAAQNVDVKSMSDEELMALLQSIMQKLEQEEPDVEAEETSVPSPVPDDMTDVVTVPETRVFSIYENKKLVIGRMPDAWFIPRETEEEDDDDTDKRRPPTERFHYGGGVYPIYGGTFSPSDIWTVW